MRQRHACLHCVRAALDGELQLLPSSWQVAEPPQAHSLIEKMVTRNIVLAPYLDQEMVNAICNARGVPVPRDPTPAEGGTAEVHCVGWVGQMLQAWGPVCAKLPDARHPAQRELLPTHRCLRLPAYCVPDRA